MNLRYTIARLTGEFKAMATSKQFSILELPDEIITLIVEEVDHVKTLIALASTSHRIQDIAERRLYRHLFVRSGDALKRCYNSTQKLSERLKAIQKLVMPCDSLELQCFTTTEEVLRKATNLKEVMIESPHCNDGGFEGLDEWMLMYDHIFKPFGSDDCLHRLEKGESLHQSSSLTIHRTGLSKRDVINLELLISHEQ